MFNIKMNGKEFKNFIEKVICNIDIKSSFEILKTVVLENNGTVLKAITTKISEHLEVRTGDYISCGIGKIAIDIDDIKLLMESKEIIEIMETSENIIFKSGRKKIKLKKYDLSSFPEEPRKQFIDMVTMSEPEFIETIKNLSVFTSWNDNNKSMNCIHFDLKNLRIESLDGHRICIKTLKPHEKLSDGNVLLHNCIIATLKKTLDKKSKENIGLSKCGEWNIVETISFAYILKAHDVDFFKTSTFLNNDYKFESEVEKVIALKVFDFYAKKIIKNEKIPVLVNFTKNSILTYADNKKLSVCDEIKVNKFSGKEILFGFNPHYLVDAFNTIDCDDIKITGYNPKAPIYMHGKEYTFIILPIYLGMYDELIEKMKYELNNVA